MEDLKTLKGEVDSIIFKSEDTGFCVLMLNCDNDLITVEIGRASCRERV
mgnify:CR=1 FL=1